MMKCLADEILTHVVSLATQCVKGVQFNWSRYLCQEFLENCREAQDETKSFHYAWMLFSIVLVAWELPKDSQFPPLDEGLLEDSQFPPLEEGLSKAAQFASLWATKDPTRITETKIFWVLMESILRMAINQRLRFSPTLYT